MHILAESESLIVEHEYEVVFQRAKKTGVVVVIADHYGDPTCAVISEDESWVATGGCGVEIYDVQSGDRVKFLRSAKPDAAHTAAEIFIESMLTRGPDELLVVGEDQDGTRTQWQIRPRELSCARES